MTDASLYLTLAIASLAGLGMLTTAALSGWRSWLALKRTKLDVALGGGGGGAGAATMPTPTAGARIEIADLKERIKKLEAIAAGVDL